MRNRHLVGIAVGLVLLGHGGVALAPPPTQSVSVTGALVELDRTYETDMNVKLRVEWWGTAGLEGFQALLGPEPGTTGSTVKFQITNSQFTSTSPDALQLVLLEGSGFLYLTGIQPYGGTDGGSTTSDGTSLIVQRKVNAPQTQVTHRFFRLDAYGASNVWVTIDGSSPLPRLVEDFSYRQRVVTIGVPGSYPLEDEVEIVPGPIKTYVNEVLALAKSAGLPTPTWP
jgi:hypothetical protein